MANYDVTARNRARASENRIHDDEVAQRYGFRGGLVPGVAIYGYACAPILDALGPAWVTGGSARMRFRAPCYEGERLHVSVGETPPVEVVALVDDRLCASGAASVEAAEWTAGVDTGIPSAAVPSERPPASDHVFRPGVVLGSIQMDTAPGVTNDYVDAIGEPSSVYREQGWVHPGMLLSAANTVLSASVVMPAWVHVESAIEHRRAVRVGEQVEVRARVVDAFERKGHHFAGLDVAWLGEDGAPVAAGRHVAIWQMAERVVS